MLWRQKKSKKVMPFELKVKKTGMFSYGSQKVLCGRKVEASEKRGESSEFQRKQAWAFGQCPKQRERKSMLSARLQI